MDHVDARVDQRVGEADLVTGCRVAPVGSPVDGRDDEVARPLGVPHAVGDVLRGGGGRRGDEGHAGTFGGGGPAVRDAARRHPEGEDQDASALPQRDGRRAPGRVRVRTRPGGAQPGGGEGAEGLGEAGPTEVEHVVVGEDADVGADGGEAGQVGRVHPVVDALAGCEVAVPGDGGLQVDHPHVRGRTLQRGQCLAPGPGRVHGPGYRSVRGLRQGDVLAGVAHVVLAQGRVTGVREDLVDAPAEHDVTGEEQGDGLLAHGGGTIRARAPCGP